MNMSAPMPRFLLPRGSIFPYAQVPKSLKPRQITNRTLPICRNASASTSKPRVLEKPTRFNPPSHGKRLKQKIPRQFGPQLTGEQKAEQKTKKYPNMMPAPGTWMYWFLTSTGIHTFIALGVLILLASITTIERWRLATDFRDQLPEASDFLFHPMTAGYQAFVAFALQNERTTAENAVRRASKIDDIQKRNSYRIAHGLLDEESQGLGGWPPAKEAIRPVGVEPGQEVKVTEAMKGGDSREGPINQGESNKKPLKKWLGIW